MFERTTKSIPPSPSARLFNKSPEFLFLRCCYHPDPNTPEFSEYSMPHLQELRFSSNQIGDAGAEKIAVALPSMPNLKEPMHQEPEP